MTQSLSLQEHTKHPMKMTRVNDLDYYYLEQGTGRVVFLLHGFPDWAGTWDSTITELSKSYRCIAPILRGYYPTSIPSDGDYSMKALATDVRGLADALGIETFDVIGHDWGASVTYSVANLCPERIGRIVTVAIPHPAFLGPSPVTLYKARHFLRFRNEKKSPPYTRKNNFAYIDTLYKRWAPNWTDYESTATLIKEQFQLEGRLEAALGYYWSFHRTLGNKELQSFYGQHPSMPLLTLFGETDGALVRKPFLAMEKAFPSDRFRLAAHKTAGHFLQQEAPDFFLEHVTSFLQETF